MVLVINGLYDRTEIIWQNEFKDSLRFLLLIVVGTLEGEHLTRAKELRMTMAAGLEVDAF